MTLYIVLIVALCITTVIEINQKQTVLQLRAGGRAISFRTTMCIPLLLLLFLGIFREITVGFDAQTYYANYWLQTDSYSWKLLFTNFSIDNGFYLLLKLLSLVIDDWWLVRAILFTLTFGLYYKGIAKETPCPSMSLIIFLGLGMLGLMFGILRQALAGAVSIIGYTQLRKGSWRKWLLFILIACSIHKTSLLCLIMLVLHFLRMKKLSGIKLVLFSAVSYILFLVSIPLVTVFAETSHKVAQHDGGYGKLIFIIAVIAFISHLLYITKSHKDEELIYLFNLSCCALFVQIGALQWSLLTRTTPFFSIYWCMLIPKLISKLPQRKQWIYYFIVAALFGFMFFYQINDVDMFVMHKF